MEKLDFEKLAIRWSELNAEYDSKIQSFFEDSSKHFSYEEIEGLKLMQRELYELELQWFEIVENLNK